MKRENVDFKFPALKLNIQCISGKDEYMASGTHSHRSVEIIHVEKGNIKVFINDFYDLIEEGETIIIGSGVLHSLELSDDVRFKYIQVNIDKYLYDLSNVKFHMLDKFIQQNQMSRFYLEKEKGELYHLFESIEREANKKDAYYDIYLKSYIYQLIALMYRKELLYDRDTFSQLDDIEEIFPVIEYIDKNFDKELSLKNLAGIINCDEYRLCRLFKKILKTSVVNYINFTRISHAQNMLLDSNKTITEIALSCGFSSVQYFNRVFKKRMKCSPKTFKALLHS
ncbi:MAG: helix-turn-helix transcriptional regulator [Clostridia bacterium]|nr:helix-turn-helix transcriptional regulator [Clostridia bacterium]